MSDPVDKRAARMPPEKGDVQVPRARRMCGQTESQKGKTKKLFSFHMKWSLQRGAAWAEGRNLRLACFGKENVNMWQMLVPGSSFWGDLLTQRKLEVPGGGHSANAQRGCQSQGPSPNSVTLSVSNTFSAPASSPVTAPIWQPPARCSYWVLEMWLALIETHSKCKMHTKFWRLGMEKSKIFH